MCMCVSPFMAGNCACTPATQTVVPAGMKRVSETPVFEVFFVSTPSAETDWTATPRRTSTPFLVRTDKDFDLDFRGKLRDKVGEAAMSVTEISRPSRARA